MKRHCIAGLVGLSLFFGVGIKHLKAKEKKTEQVLPEIVITATRTQMPISEVSSSITVITRKQIEDSGAKTVLDIIKTVPGIFVYSTSGNLIEGAVSLRGFNPYGSERVLVMVDGVPINSSSDGFVNWAKVPPIEDIEKIEIVRGPTSALYGPFAMGGVINIITKSGAKKTQKTVELAFGSYNEQKYRANVRGTSGNMGYNLGATYWQGDGWREHSNFYKRDFVGKFNIALDDTSRLILNFNYQNTYRLYPGKLTLSQYEQDPRQSIPANWYSESGDLESWMSQVGYEKKLGFHHFETKLFATHYEYDYPGPTYHYLGNNNGIGGNLKYTLTSPLFGKQNSFLIGLDFRKEKLDYQYFYNGNLSKDRTTIPLFWGSYVEDNFGFSRFLSITGALRFDQAKYDYTDRLNSANNNKKTFDKFSPKFGITLSFKPNFILFGNIAEAFMPPDPYKLFISRYANPNLEPEEAINYEIGLRTTLFNRLKFDITAYLMNVKKEIILSGTQYQNTGKVRHKGIESSLNFKILPSLSAFFNLTYQEVKFVDYLNYDGNYRPYAPKYLISWGIDYNIPIGIYFNVNANLVDHYYADSANTKKVPGYTVWNGKLGYKKKNFHLYVEVNNIFDKRYYYMNSYGYVYPYDGRTFLVGASVSF